MCHCFPVSFRLPPFASWPSCPAAGFGPPYGRLTGIWSFSRTVTGFPRFAHVSSGRFRASSLPRGHGARMTGCNLPVNIAASQRQALTASDTHHRWRLR